VRYRQLPDNAGDADCWDGQNHEVAESKHEEKCDRAEDKKVAERHPQRQHEDERLQQEAEVRQPVNYYCSSVQRLN
jgi:hypothetical protein